jgi:hypothetical protein
MGTPSDTALRATFAFDAPLPFLDVASRVSCASAVLPAYTSTRASRPARAGASTIPRTH